MSSLTDCLCSYYKGCFWPDDYNFNPNGRTSALVPEPTGRLTYNTFTHQYVQETRTTLVNMGSAAAVDNYYRTILKVLQVALCQGAGLGMVTLACINPSGTLGSALGWGISGSIACLTGMGCGTRYYVAYKRSTDPNCCTMV